MVVLSSTLPPLRKCSRGLSMGNLVVSWFVSVVAERVSGLLRRGWVYP